MPDRNRPIHERMDAQEVVRLLDLQPHPEGGHFRESWRDPDGSDGSRGHGTAIYFLLPRGVTSHWHRVDAVEIWHHYAGAPLELLVGLEEPVTDETILLGSELLLGERPQGIVPAHAWQSARSLGDWTLVGCTVSPAFRFEGFEMVRD